MYTKKKFFKKKTSRKIRKTKNKSKFRKTRTTRKTYKNGKPRKYSGGGEWLTSNTKNISPEDECPICFKEFSKTPDLAIYETDCGHKFHNNCLNKHCIKVEENPFSEKDEDGYPIMRCPLCRKNLRTERSDQCTDVWAFREKALDENTLEPTLREIYDKQKESRDDEDEDDEN